MAGSAFGQQPASTAYVLSERGLYATALASLTIGADGSVTGTEFVRARGINMTYAVQGTLAANDDGSKTLTFSRTSTDAVDMNGDPLLSSEVLKLIVQPGGGYVALRTDPGQYAYGDLLTAASTPAPGSYLVNGNEIDPGSMCIDMITLDAAGNVAGNRVENSLGLITEKPLSGSYSATGNGFYTIQFNVTSSDSDGSQVATTETYLALPTSKDVKMIRVDRSSGLLTLTR